VPGTTNKGIVGNELTSTFGNGPLPYNAPQPFGQPSAAQGPPSGAPSTPPVGPSPVVTELGPEATDSSKLLAEYEDTVRANGAAATKQTGPLQEMTEALKVLHGKTGPLLPVESKVAGMAQAVGNIVS